MSRKSTLVAEIQAEESAGNGSPLRRSSRISTANVTPATVGTRRASQNAQSETGPAKATKGWRGSASQEIEEVLSDTKPTPRGRRAILTEEDTATSTPKRQTRASSKPPDDTPQPAKPRGRRTSTSSDVSEKSTEDKKAPVRGRRTSTSSDVSEIVDDKKPPARGRRRSASTSEVEADAPPKTLRSRRVSASSNTVEVAKEVVTTTVTTRTRRGSVSKEVEETAQPVKARVTRSRRGSTSNEDMEEKEDNVNTSEKKTRSRRNSVDKEVVEQPKPATPIKMKRRLSITENAVNLDPIDEASPQKSEDVYVAVEKLAVPAKKTDLDLSVINESITEDVELQSIEAENQNILSDAIQSTKLQDIINKDLRRLSRSPIRRSPRLSNSPEVRRSPRLSISPDVRKSPRLSNSPAPKTTNMVAKRSLELSEENTNEGSVSSTENKNKGTITDGLDGSFTFNLNKSVFDNTRIDENVPTSTEEIEEVQDSKPQDESVTLNTSKSSNNSDKENISTLSNLKVEQNTVVKESTVHIVKEVVVPRISNVFRPKMIENSFCEPMEVEELPSNSSKFNLDATSAAIDESEIIINDPTDFEPSSNTANNYSVGRDLQNENLDSPINESFNLCLTVSEEQFDETKLNQTSNEKLNTEENVINISDEHSQNKDSTPLSPSSVAVEVGSPKKLISPMSNSEINQKESMSPVLGKSLTDIPKNRLSSDTSEEPTKEPVLILDRTEIQDSDIDNIKEEDIDSYNQTESGKCEKSVDYSFQIPTDDDDDDTFEEKLDASKFQNNETSSDINQPKSPIVEQIVSPLKRKTPSPEKEAKKLKMSPEKDSLETEDTHEVGEIIEHEKSQEVTSTNGNEPTVEEISETNEKELETNDTKGMEAPHSSSNEEKNKNLYSGRKFEDHDSGCSSTLHSSNEEHIIEVDTNVSLSKDNIKENLATRDIGDTNLKESESLVEEASAQESNTEIQLQETSCMCKDLKDVESLVNTTSTTLHACLDTSNTQDVLVTETTITTEVTTTKSSCEVLEKDHKASSEVNEELENEPKEFTEAKNLITPAIETLINTSAKAILDDFQARRSSCSEEDSKTASAKKSKKKSLRNSLPLVDSSRGKNEKCSSVIKTIKSRRGSLPDVTVIELSKTETTVEFQETKLSNIHKKEQNAEETTSVMEIEDESVIPTKDDFPEHTSKSNISDDKTVSPNKNKSKKNKKKLKLKEGNLNKSLQIEDTEDDDIVDEESEVIPSKEQDDIFEQTSKSDISQDKTVSSNKNKTKKKKKKSPLKESEDVNKSFQIEDTDEDNMVNENIENDSYAKLNNSKSSKNKDISDPNITQEDPDVEVNLTTKNQLFEKFANSKMDEYLNKKLKELCDDDDESSEEVVNSRKFEQSEHYDDSDVNKESDDEDFIDDQAEEGEEDTPSEDSNAIIDHGESVGSSDSEFDDSDETYEEDSFVCDDDNVDDELLSGEEYDLGDEKKKNKKSRIIKITDEHQVGDNVVIPKKQRKNKSVISISSSDEEEVKEVIPKPIEIKEEIIRKRNSSVTIHENITVGDLKDSNLTERITKVVNSFCSSISDGKISLNLSLESISTETEQKQESGLRKSSEGISKHYKPLKEAPKTNESVENIVVSSSSEQINLDTSKSSGLEIEEIPSTSRKLSSSYTVKDSDFKKHKKSKRRLSKSLEELTETSKSSKKLKVIDDVKQNKKLKKKKDKSKKEISMSKEALTAAALSTFNLVDKLITDVKNRPVRTIKPSSSMEDVNSSWVVDDKVKSIKPSTSLATKKEKQMKFHPKDFKNQMLYETGGIKRMETKKLLKKKGI